jgi:hypothetical protein
MTPLDLPSWLRFLPGDLELFRANGGAEGLEAKGLRAYVALLPKDVLEGLEALGWRYVHTGRLAGVLRATLATLLQQEGLPVPNPETSGCTVTLPKDLVERLDAMRRHYIETKRIPAETDLGLMLRGLLLHVLEEKGFPVRQGPRMALVESARVKGES